MKIQNLITLIVSALELSLALLANSSQCHLGCEKISYFSTLDRNIIKYLDEYGAINQIIYGANPMRTEKFFVQEYLRFYICLYYIKKHLYPAFRLEHVQVRLGLRM